MRLIDIAQRTPEWRIWRRQGVTASDAPVVLGVSPFKSRWRLWAEKTGLNEEVEVDTPDIRRGIEEEPKARLAFEKKYDTLLLPVCGEHDTYPILRASFDGVEKGRPVEIKAPSEKTFAKVCRNGPSEIHRIQLQHQMLVAGSDSGWLVYWCAGEMIEFHLPFDPALADRIVAESLAFWEKVQSGTEPEEVLPHDIFLPGSSWQELEDSYRALLAKKKALEADLAEVQAGIKALENKMLADLGDLAVAETEGIRVCRFLRRGAIDYKKAIFALLPGLEEADLEQFRREAHVHVKVTLKKKK